MKLKLALLALIMGGGFASPALADAEKDASLAAKRKVAEVFGDCLVENKSRRERAIDFVLTGDPQQGIRLANSQCFTEAMSSQRLRSETMEGKYSLRAMQTLVANAVVRHDFRKSGPTDFSKIAPLTSTPVQFGKDLDSETAAMLDRLGECAARLSPEGVRQLAMTKVETPAELSALRALVPAFSQCLPNDVTLRFPPSVLRDVAVTTYARLAYSALQSREGPAALKGEK